MQSLISWLDGVRSSAFSLSLTAFLLVNGVAVLAFLVRKDRTLVNRWTGRVLAANILLLGTGVGIPAAAWLARTALVTFASTNTLIPRIGERDEVPLRP